MQEILVLPVNESHLDACCKCEQTATEAWGFDALAETLKSDTGRIFVALDKNMVVGVCVFQLAADEASLASITVLPEYRGKKIGKQLLCEAMQNLKKQGATRFFLEVRSQNIAAIRLYTSLGFIVAGLRKGFYKNPEDNAVVMNIIF